MRIARAVAALVVLVFATGCVGSSQPSRSGSASTSATPVDLASAEDAWQRAAIRDYSLDVTITGCMACAHPLRYSVSVVDGQVTDQTVPQHLGVKHDRAPTVEDLFHTIRWYQRQGADVDRMVTYNDVGVPVAMNLNVSNMTDVQAHYAVTFTSPDLVATPSPGMVAVPAVVGLDLTAARHALRSDGLIPDLQVVTGTYRHAAVVRQDPAPGTVVPPGATVNLVLGPA